MKNENRSNER